MNMIMTIASFVLLGALLLSGNNAVTNNMQLAIDNEFSIASFGLAQSLIDEAKTKAFDQNTAGGIEVADSTGLSEYLGPDAAEFPPFTDVPTDAGYWSAIKFNDVDDYHGYRRAAPSAQRSDLDAGVVYDTLSATVLYVSMVDPKIPSAEKTYRKKMTVTVRGVHIRHPYTMSYIFTY